MTHLGPLDKPEFIHPTASISPLADLESSIKGSKIIIGPRCHIDSFVKVKMAGGIGDVIIGHDCFINSGCVLYSGNGINIGDNVLIAANCTLAPVNHNFRDRNQIISAQGFAPSRGGIVVEDDVWIGANSVLLDGSILRRGSVVAAGSLVLGEMPPYSICKGSPAKPFDFRN